MTIFYRKSENKCRRKNNKQCEAFGLTQFWKDPDCDWTSKKIWCGQDVKNYHSI